MTIVILDTDFLCSFLKIQKMPLLREFYKGSRIIICTAVYREVALTNLLPQLIALTWLEVLPEPAMKVTELEADREFANLGAGEQASIAFALTELQSILLISDNRARKSAERLGVRTANIPAFLLACKQAGNLHPDEIRVIINDLRERDYYEFRSDVLALLLK